MSYICECGCSVNYLGALCCDCEEKSQAWNAASNLVSIVKNNPASTTSEIYLANAIEQILCLVK